MLAYSSIAHAGYLLVGVAAMGLGVPDAQSSVLFYLGAYTFTTLGTFGVVAWVGRRGDERLYVGTLDGALVLDLRTQKWTRLRDELPMPTVLSVAGRGGQIYFGTTGGLARFDTSFFNSAD